MRASSRWDDDIKTDFKEIGAQDVNWVSMTQTWDTLRPLTNEIKKYRASNNENIF